MVSLDCSTGIFLETGESPVTLSPKINIPVAMSSKRRVNLTRALLLDLFYQAQLVYHQPINFVLNAWYYDSHHLSI